MLWSEVEDFTIVKQASWNIDLTRQLFRLTVVDLANLLAQLVYSLSQVFTSLEIHTFKRSTLVLFFYVSLLAPQLYVLNFFEFNIPRSLQTDHLV